MQRAAHERPQPAHDTEEARLPAAVVPRDDDALSWLDRNVEVAKEQHAVGLVDVDVPVY